MTREEAISVIMFEYPQRENYPILCDALDMAIEALKAQEWIPCSERLPEEDGSYLIVDKDGFIGRTFYEDDFGRPRWGYRDVIAWMPLPEPYQE